MESRTRTRIPKKLYSSNTEAEKYVKKKSKNLPKKSKKTTKQSNDSQHVKKSFANAKLVKQLKANEFLHQVQNFEGSDEEVTAKSRRIKRSTKLRFPVKNFCCDHCDEKFISKSSIILHMMSHDDPSKIL